MSHEKLTIRTPGKLMVAGEYAVLEPHQQLITMAVNRYVYVTIEKSPTNQLHLTDFDLINLTWEYDGHHIVINNEDDRTSFVKEALYIAHTYLNEQQIQFQPTSLTIKSDLQDDSGVKYGLGSSAAVVTAVIAAVLHMHLSEKPTKDLIFKLASIAHLNVQKSGSGADVAASTYGGMVQYSSFQANWLLTAYEKCVTLTSLLEKDWPYLLIKKLHWPDHFNICIGWTGTPASTTHLVDKVLNFKSTHLEQYDLFLKESEQAVQLMIKGIETSDFNQFSEGIRKNRGALTQLGKQAGVDIETERLRILSDLAESFSGTGKLSGAGGGDCGLAFFSSDRFNDALFNAWEEQGVMPLSLTIDLTGTTKLSL